jgi:hypothetical protein
MPPLPPAQAVARLSGLRSLNLRGCSQLGDHHLSAMLAGLAGLRALSLQSCNGMTGAPRACPQHKRACRGAAALAGLRNTRSCADVCWAALPSSAPLTDTACRLAPLLPSLSAGEFLRSLARGAPGLSSLNLSHCMRLEEGHLAALAALPGLRRLDLTGCQAARGIGSLSGLAALTCLRAAGWTQRWAPGGAHGRAAVRGRRGGGAAEGEPRRDAAGGGDGSGAGGAVAAEEWRAPAGIARLDMRGATMSVGALAALLRGLPQGLESLDVSHCQLLADDSDGSGGRAEGGGDARLSDGSDGGEGDGGHADALAAAARAAAAAYLARATGGGRGGGGGNGADATAGGLAALSALAARQEGEPQLAVADVAAVSRLSALTALSLSGVGPDLGTASGAGARGHCYGSGKSGGPKAARLTSPRRGGGGGIEAQREGSGPTSHAALPASWPPGGLEAIGVLGSRQHMPATAWRGREQTAANSSGCRDGGGGGGGVLRGSRVRRVLDLDSWAGEGPGALQLSSRLRVQRLLGESGDALDDSGGSASGSFVAAGWGGPFGDAGGSSSGSSCGSGSWADAGGSGSGSPTVVALYGGGVLAGEGSGAGSPRAVSVSWGHAVGITSTTHSRHASGPAATAAVAAGRLHWQAGEWPAQREEQAASSVAPLPPFVPPQSAEWLLPLQRLQRLALTRCAWLDDAALAALGALSLLRCLDVGGCRRLTGSGFAALRGLGALTELSCGGCVALDDRGVAAIASALGGSLRRLDLSGCEGVGDAGAACLGCATALAGLSLAGVRGIGARCGRGGALGRGAWGGSGLGLECTSVILPRPTSPAACPFPPLGQRLCLCSRAPS